MLSFIDSHAHLASPAFDGDEDGVVARAREAGAAFPALVAAFGRELHEFIVDWCDRLEATLAPEAEKA